MVLPRQQNASPPKQSARKFAHSQSSHNIPVRTAILNIGQLATLAGSKQPRIGPEMSELGILANAGILINASGTVSMVGSTDEIARKVSKHDKVVDAAGRLVTPGFVDAHTHAIFAGIRANEFELRSQGSTYQEIKAAGGGILSTVNATREASEEELTRKAGEHLRWMLSHGTTTVEVKSGYGLDLETELKMLRVAKKLGPQHVQPTFLGAHSVPPGKTKDEYLDEMIAMLPDVEKLALGCDIFVEEGYFTPDDARRLFSSTKLWRRLHVDQFGDHGGAALAAELKAKTADHLEYTGAEGIRALAMAGVMPVLLPASVYCLGLDKYADARGMIDAGLPVVLATDFNPGTSPCPSLPFVMSLACTQMKMSPAEALTACTVNAAHALSCGETLGSIEIGNMRISSSTMPRTTERFPTGPDGTRPTRC